MEYRILYEPFKTLEEQDQAERELKLHAEMVSAVEQEQQELLLAIVEGDVVYLPLQPFDK